MRNKIISVSVALVALVFMAPEQASFAAANTNFVVIVNKANTTNELSMQDVRLIFKGMKKKWNTGGKIFPLNLPLGYLLRTDFDKAVLNFSPSESSEYWVQQKIKAAARRPVTQRSTAAVKSIVAKLPEAIGYIPSDEVDDSVKVVYTHSQ